MPDVVVVGGGIIGVACAEQLAARGASVTLVERDHLAAGASGRNAGLWATPDDPATVEMARRSLARYLDLADTTPFPVVADREAYGLVSVTTDEDEDDIADAVRRLQELGVKAEHLRPEELHELEPAISPAFTGAWLVHDGRRVDPTALTVGLALRARELGARIQHHLTVRSLTMAGDRVTGVITDDGVIASADVVIAAGPWSGTLLDPVGVRLRIIATRGWLVRLAPERPPISRWVEASGRSLFRRPVRAITAGDYARESGELDLGATLQPLPNGTLLAGSSRQLALTDEPDDPSVPREIVRGAIELVPALADATVESAWWGIRPMTPDDRPIVGRVRDGLVVATGHGSEGVILGAGTAELVASILIGDEPPFDPAPFHPSRLA